VCVGWHVDSHSTNGGWHTTVRDGHYPSSGASNDARGSSEPCEHRSSPEANEGSCSLPERNRGGTPLVGREPPAQTAHLRRASHS